MQDVILVGHSQAGTLLPRLAERRPGLFRRLIYVSCCAPLPGQTILQMIGSGSARQPPGRSGLAARPSATSASAAVSSHVLQRHGRRGSGAFPRQTGPRPLARSVHAGVGLALRSPDKHSASTFVLCLQDGILTPAWQERFAQRLHTQRMVRIDAGHQVMNTRPHALAELLRHEASITSPLQSLQAMPEFRSPHSASAERSPSLPAERAALGSASRLFWPKPVPPWSSPIAMRELPSVWLRI